MNSFAATRAHEGAWQGIYTHIDQDANILDTHQSYVRCEFPAAGPIFYRQHIHFTWEDGRERRDMFEGVIDGDRLRYDTPTFFGHSWDSADGLVLLNLQRKDEAGAHFFEVICMGDGGDHRSRTWHWFRDGRLYRRTLCEETRVC